MQGDKDDMYEAQRLAQLFLIQDIPQDTTLSAVQLFNMWVDKTGFKFQEPINAAWLLEYLENHRNFDRERITMLAKLDGFL